MRKAVSWHPTAQIIGPSTEDKTSRRSEEIREGSIDVTNLDWEFEEKEDKSDENKVEKQPSVNQEKSPVVYMALRQLAGHNAPASQAVMTVTRRTGAPGALVLTATRA